jgi:hypothetical protein
MEARSLHYVMSSLSRRLAQPIRPMLPDRFATFPHAPFDSCVTNRDEAINLRRDDGRVLAGKPVGVALALDNAMLCQHLLRHRGSDVLVVLQRALIVREERSSDRTPSGTTAP